MLKKVLISVGVLILLAAGAAFYLNHRNRTLSPPETVTATSNGLTMTLDYSRPSVRSRVIFGTEAEQAIQPYGKYWRFGANESTEFSIDREAVINGQRLKPGRYKIYAFPGADGFEIGISTDTGTWGASEPDYTKDVMRFWARAERKSTPTEQHTIGLQSTATGLKMTMDFEYVHLEFPIDPAP